MSTDVLVRITPATDRDEVFAILTDAFERDPAVRMLYPDRAAYREHFPVFAALFAGPSLAAGGADRAADGLGAALWLPPGVEADPEPLIAYLEASLPAERRDRIMAGLEIQAGLHPHEPHWYLPFIGVRPEAQRLGIGAALLAHGLARADADGLPAYLEATSRTSVPLYRRFGFEVTGVVEADDYPEIFAMWRRARR
jgi:ribosomal protein S18 acetylase RimI-like enzyme